MVLTSQQKSMLMRKTSQTGPLSVARTQVASISTDTPEHLDFWRAAGQAPHSARRQVSPTCPRAACDTIAAGTAAAAQCSRRIAACSAGRGSPAAHLKLYAGMPARSTNIAQQKVLHCTLACCCLCRTRAGALPSCAQRVPCSVAWASIRTKPSGASCPGQHRDSTGREQAGWLTSRHAMHRSTPAQCWRATRRAAPRASG